MRILIGIYLTAGALQLLLAQCGFAFAIYVFYHEVVGPRQNNHWAELLGMSILLYILGLFPILAAYGLWQRKPLLRLFLLVLSWWNVIVGSYALVVAGAMLVGVTDGRALGIDQPPSETLFIAALVLTYAGFQLSVLMHSSVRESFQKQKKRPRPNTQNRNNNTDTELADQLS